MAREAAHGAAALEGLATGRVAVGDRDWAIGGAGLGLRGRVVW